MRLTKLSLPALAVSAALFATGCPPSIQSFQVVPSEVCPDGQVNVSWSATADRVTITTDPSGTTSIPAGLSSGPRNNTTITATHDFDVILTAFRSGQVSQRRSVHVVREERPYTIAGRTECRDGMLFVNATAAVDPLLDAMRTWTVTPGASFRPLTVQHAGVTLTFPPAGVESFRGTPVGGPWIITAPLLAGETCGSTGAVNAVPSTAPATLSLSVTGTCGGRLPEPRQSRGGSQGNAGQPCFGDGSCYSTLQCRILDRTCIDPANPPLAGQTVRCNGQPATAQTRAYTIGLEDRNGCGAQVTVYADSQAEAEQCAPRALSIPTTVASGTLESHAFCVNSDTVYYSAFSPEAAARCVRGVYGQTASITPGICRR